MSTEHSLTCGIEPLSGIAVVKMVGALDSAAAEDVRRAFGAIEPKRNAPIVLDMSAVPYVDSEGFGTLIGIQKRLTEAGGSLVLVGCQEPVRSALSLTRLEVLFPSYAAVHQVPKTRH